MTVWRMVMQNYTRSAGEGSKPFFFFVLRKLYIEGGINDIA